VSIKPLSQAVRSALLPLSTAALALGAAGSVLAQDTPPKEEATNLDRIQVTGSRIKRADLETSSPVFTIDRQNIESSGAATVGEFLQRTPAIAGAATNPQVNNGGGAGAATVDLRGLGVNRSLVLVDGKRWIQRQWRGGRELHPDGTDRTRGSAQGRRLGDLRLRRHRWRGQLHPAQGLPGTGSQRLLWHFLAR
jgi:outer membrane receptor for ferrienterochelin and colicin